jgi:hypothetical protein
MACRAANSKDKEISVIGQPRGMMAGIVLLGLVQGLAGCGTSGSPAAPSAPPAPSPVAPPTAIQLVVFTDVASGFSTSEVRDVDDQILHFSTAPALIWTDGRSFSGYAANGASVAADSVCASCFFLIRFGTRDGERRAYLTWPDLEQHGRADHPAPTILDIEVDGGTVVVTDTSVRVPGWD